MSDMVSGYVKGGITQGGQSTGVGYDPDVDGPIIHPDTAKRWARRELARLNNGAPVEEAPAPLNKDTPSNREGPRSSWGAPQRPG